jgi:hypothetical protein
VLDLNVEATDHSLHLVKLLFVRVSTVTACRCVVAKLKVPDGLMSSPISDTSWDLWALIILDVRRRNIDGCFVLATGYRSSQSISSISSSNFCLASLSGERVGLRSLHGRRRFFRRRDASIFSFRCLQGHFENGRQSWGTVTGWY